MKKLNTKGLESNNFLKLISDGGVDKGFSGIVTSDVGKNIQKGNNF